jgi:hypothetical protein
MPGQAPSSRRRVWSIALYGFLPGFLILLLLVGWAMGIENATAVLQSSDSPDGRYRAQVVREDPGVSSGYEYMVRVMPAGLPMVVRSLRILPFTPVYVALDAHHEPDELRVRWTGPQEVTIHCQGCGGTGPGDARWRDIQLRYELN